MGDEKYTEHQKLADDAAQSHTDAAAAASLNVATGGDVDALDDEARTSAEKVARENAERSARENAGTDVEQARGGYVAAAVKNGHPEAVTQSAGVKASVPGQGQSKAVSTATERKLNRGGGANTSTK